MKERQNEAHYIGHACHECRETDIRDTCIFYYYALADGIRTIFKRIGKVPFYPRRHKPAPSAQVLL